jgi:hypothetical protein
MKVTWTYNPYLPNLSIFIFYPTTTLSMYVLVQNPTIVNVSKLWFELPTCSKPYCCSNTTKLLFFTTKTCTAIACRSSWLWYLIIFYCKLYIYFHSFFFICICSFFSHLSSYRRSLESPSFYKCFAWKIFEHLCNFWWTFTF